jgi:hypothetical protein
VVTCISEPYTLNTGTVPGDGEQAHLVVRSLKSLLWSTNFKLNGFMVIADLRSFFLRYAVPITGHMALIRTSVEYSLPSKFRKI